jgi:hypothetical protein
MDFCVNLLDINMETHTYPGDREMPLAKVVRWAVAVMAMAAVPAITFAAAAPEYKTSWEHYLALKSAAKGGNRMTWDKLPDWSGVWVRAGGFAGLNWDASQRPGQRAPAVLTPEYQQRYDRKLELLAKGIENDPIAQCLPAGHPRFLAEPYPREFVLRPERAWLIMEEGNEVRRVYMDGRDHLPADEAQPQPHGDSIGFWDGDTLVVHTKDLRAGQYQKNQPDYSDQITSVERIRKVDANTIEDDITVYDPPALAKPWRVVARFSKITDLPNLRLNYWPCVENNRVIVNPDGTISMKLENAGSP